MGIISFEVDLLGKLQFQYLQSNAVQIKHSTNRICRIRQEKGKSSIRSHCHMTLCAHIKLYHSTNTTCLKIQTQSANIGLHVTHTKKMNKIFLSLHKIMSKLVRIKSAFRLVSPSRLIPLSDQAKLALRPQASLTWLVPVRQIFSSSI